jgi:hypothetical protein
LGTLIVRHVFQSLGTLWNGRCSHILECELEDQTILLQIGQVADESIVRLMLPKTQISKFPVLQPSHAEDQREGLTGNQEWGVSPEKTGEKSEGFSE